MQGVAGAASSRSIAARIAWAAALATAACGSIGCAAAVPMPATFSGTMAAVAADASRASDLALVRARVDEAGVEVAPIPPDRLPSTWRVLEARKARPFAFVSAVHVARDRCTRREARGGCTSAEVYLVLRDGTRAPRLTIPPPKGEPPDKLSSLAWILGVSTLALPVVSIASGHDLVSPWAPNEKPPPEAELKAWHALEEEQRRAGVYAQTTREGGAYAYGEIVGLPPDGEVDHVEVQAWLLFGREEQRCEVTLSRPATPLLRGETLTFTSDDLRTLACAPRTARRHGKPGRQAPAVLTDR